MIYINFVAFSTHVSKQIDEFIFSPIFNSIIFRIFVFILKTSRTIGRIFFFVFYIIFIVYCLILYGLSCSRFCFLKIDLQSSFILKSTCPESERFGSDSRARLAYYSSPQLVYCFLAIVYWAEKCVNAPRICVGVVATDGFCLSLNECAYRHA